MTNITIVDNLFLAKDVAEELGYSKTEAMTRKLPKSELKKLNYNSRQTGFITPLGLILLSRKIEDDDKAKALIELALSQYSLSSSSEKEIARLNEIIADYAEELSDGEAKQAAYRKMVHNSYSKALKETEEARAGYEMRKEERLRRIRTLESELHAVKDELHALKSFVKFKGL